jgi:hypothetical protein
MVDRFEGPGLARLDHRAEDLTQAPLRMFRLEAPESLYTQPVRE